MLDETRVGDVVVLTLDQPERRNALSKAMRDSLTAAFERLDRDDALRAIIIVGAGNMFCSGGDVSEMNVADGAEAEERLRLIHHMVRVIAGCRKLVIAAIEGWAAGAGLSLALLCDTMIASESAKFVASFGKMGLIGDLGALHTLPARVGLAQARQMLFYAEPVDAGAAHALGLVDHVVSTGRALDFALERAALTRAVAPRPIALTKAMFAQDLERILDREKNLQPQLYLSADHREAKRALLEKRVPTFLNR